MNRDKEINTVLSHGSDDYEITVIFKRQLSDDLRCGGPSIESDMPVGEALLHQFVNELQTAYNATGMAGTFEVVAGPSVCLGHRIYNQEYKPIVVTKTKDIVSRVAGRLIGIVDTDLTTAERQITKLLVDAEYLRVDESGTIVELD